jgi:hypothetical protein
MSNANVSLFRFARRASGANDNRIFTGFSHFGAAQLHRRPVSGAIFPRVATASSHDSDPYLLVLLADQEIAANRPEQARSLIEAAYAVYDQARLGS